MGIVIGPVSQIMTRYLVWVDCMHAPKLLADNDQQLLFWENTVNSLNARQLNAISWGTEVDYRAKTQKGIRLDFRILIVKIVLDIKPLYSNAPRIAFCGKMHFVCRIGQVKQRS